MFNNTLKNAIILFTINHRSSLPFCQGENDEQTFVFKTSSKLLCPLLRRTDTQTMWFGPCFPAWKLNKIIQYILGCSSPAFFFFFLLKRFQLSFEHNNIKPFRSVYLFLHLGKHMNTIGSYFSFFGFRFDGGVPCTWYWYNSWTATAVCYITHRR